MKSILVRVFALMLLCSLVGACDDSKPTQSTGGGGTSSKAGNAQGAQQIKSLGEQ